MRRFAITFAALALFFAAGLHAQVPDTVQSEWSPPGAFTVDTTTVSSAIWKPVEWTDVVYESDLCFVMVTALDTLTLNPTEWDEGEAGGGPDTGEWHNVHFFPNSGQTSGGAVSGFTPAGHISDDISGSAVSLDFIGTGCAFEGRQDITAPPVGVGTGGGGGPPSPRLIFSQIPGAASSYNKIFVLVEHVLESAAMFGGEEWQNNNGGVKLFRVLCGGCGGGPQGMIVDMLDGTVVGQGAGRVSGCTILRANVWTFWPSHAGDVITSSDPCKDDGGDEGWTTGVTIRYWACIDADPDHDGNPTDGDLAVLSHGYDEAEGIMMYYEPSDLTSAIDAGAVTGIMEDNTWGGGGTRVRSFSKWLTYIKVWSGDGTGVSCTVPPIAPWT